MPVLISMSPTVETRIVYSHRTVGNEVAIAFCCELTARSRHGLARVLIDHKANLEVRARIT